jgi:ATP-dependent exoDNAse (exonuclease V) alpha subunit
MKGQLVQVGGTQPLPLDQSERFQLFHSGTIALAAGDMIRITNNGSTADKKHALHNGDLYRVRKFDDEGNIVLANGSSIAKGFGHIDYGYVVTSHASQGKTVDRVLVGQSSDSFPASSQEQFYVSASRARKSVTVYTDNKQALRQAISRSDTRLSATELLRGSDGDTLHNLHVRHASELEVALAAAKSRKVRTLEEQSIER